MQSPRPSLTVQPRPDSSLTANGGQKERDLRYLASHGVVDHMVRHAVGKIRSPKITRTIIETTVSLGRRDSGGSSRYASEARRAADAAQETNWCSILPGSVFRRDTAWHHQHQQRGPDQGFLIKRDQLRRSMKREWMCAPWLKWWRSVGDFLAP